MKVVLKNWQGDQVAKLLRRAAAKGMSDAAEHLLETANRTVPIEEAVLAGSGVASVDAENLQAAVSYDTPYAVVQHEDTTLRHDSGRRAKWLQLAAQEESQAIARYVAETIRKEAS